MPLASVGTWGCTISPPQGQSFFASPAMMLQTSLASRVPLNESGAITILFITGPLSTKGRRMVYLPALDFQFFSLSRARIAPAADSSCSMSSSFSRRVTKR